MMYGVSLWYEYWKISRFYGQKVAKRSQVPLINHINEGLQVLEHLNASEFSARAFCLHPIIQADEDLAQNIHVLARSMSGVPNGPYVLALAMEYRSVANAYLAHCKMPETGIRLSPWEEVNDMLVADKVQNRKDYELYHEGKHENSQRLTQYFTEWIEALGAEQDYPMLKAMLLG